MYILIGENIRDFRIPVKGKFEFKISLRFQGQFYKKILP